MNEPGYMIGAIAVMALVMFGLRAFPFLLFDRGRGAPPLVIYIGKVIPPATIAMLIVYCMNGVDLRTGNHGMPELIAGAAIVAVHAWKRNAVLSVFGGTLLYMALVQYVF